MQKLIACLIEQYVNGSNVVDCKYILHNINVGQDAYQGC